MAIGWRDNRGRFRPVPGARAGEFRSVETGAGPCVVKMIAEDDPAYQPRTYSLTCNVNSDGLVGKCDCGWMVALPDFAFPTPKKAMGEAQRRHNDHVKEKHS